MKLIIQGDRIAATATDEYTGPDAFIDAPDDFDIERLSEYRVTPDGELIVTAPQAVTMRQARLALLSIGLLDDVEAAIAQIGGAAKIEWEYATEVRRDARLVDQIKQMLNMDSATLDELFDVAAKL